jgi:type I restriction enzyme, S subunit
MNFINNDAAVPGLNRNQAYSNKLFFPGYDLIERFSAKADPIFEMKHKLLVQNETLKRTRDLLLPRLVAGKLLVEKLDIDFPPSMSDKNKESKRKHA